MQRVRATNNRVAERASRRRGSRFGMIALLATLLLLAGGEGTLAGVSEAETSVPGAGQESDQGVSGNGCGPDRPDEHLICPAPDEESHQYIERIFSDVAGNGIAIRLTEAGLRMANSCSGSEALAVMVADLYARIPGHERAEESIQWAIPQMTGEIRGHAIAYRMAITESIRNRANPVNIVFPEYRGEFAGGMSGLTERAQQLLWNTLC